MSAKDLGEYVDGLYGYALVLSRGRTEAEDLVQETYLRAIETVETSRRDSSVKSWLFIILRSIWFNQPRQSRTVPEVIELDSDGNDPIRDAGFATDPPLTPCASNNEQDQVRTALQQLPIEFREILILHEYEELSYQEIASVLECPLGTVMSRLARARSKLRELLSPL
jgi:RNA polymerase sigma-70 factor (ECF subfamily)